ncbi:MAG TPA: GNAT family N-acetyltransferase [Gemmatimonadales bacterium]|nr:GNAT family N-acetyltransferase [Gemmatimonadales bacterium]
MIRPMTPADWPAVRRIYAEGLAAGNASFETEVPDWSAWNAGHLPGARLVAEPDGEVVGWAALMPVSARACFRGVAEVSVYVARAARGAGVGRALLDSLIAASETEGIWTLWSSIHTDNPASVALHARCGFRMIGRRERIALRAGVWTDTYNMERRSGVVGV